MAALDLPALSARFPASVGWCGSQEQLVEFYESEEFLVGTVREFVGEALRNEDLATIVIATAPHRRAFEAAFRVSGVDVDAARATGQYAAVDAALLLESFMVDGRPDAGRFRDAVGRLIERSSAGGRRVRIYSEMVMLLWNAGDSASTIVLGDLWNALEATYPFALLCAYPMKSFEEERGAPVFERICDQHSTVIPAESYSLRKGHDAQHRAAAQLQREVVALRRALEQMSSERDALHRLAHVDPLTGLGNRRAFQRHLAREWKLCHRGGIDSFVVIADLDRFKEHNDLHGHGAGDQILREFATTLRGAARSTDILCRIGGDEFGIILIHSDSRGVETFLRRVNHMMAAAEHPLLPEVDVSLGRASLGRSTSPAQAFERADQAMYSNKRSALCRGALPEAPRYPRRRPASDPRHVGPSEVDARSA